MLLRSKIRQDAQQSTPYVLTSLLGPRVVLDQQGAKKTVGSHHLMQQYRMLFRKFQLCRELYRKEVMCRHEVCKLVARTTSMGNCVPVNFPKMTITPKFMQLVVEFPKRAIKFASIGDSNEQSVENMHSTGKRWRRNFMSTRNKEKRGLLFMQKQWQERSAGSLQDYRWP